MVKRVSGNCHSPLKQPQVDHHSSNRIGTSADCHLGAVAMTMDTPARVCVDGPIEGVRGIEAKLFAEFEHQRIPIILCDWSDNRQRGFSVQ